VVPTALLVVAEAVASALAATPWLRAYRVPDAAWLLVLAAVAAVSLSAALSRWRAVAPLVTYGASALGLVALVALADGPHPLAALRSLTGAAPHLLSETLPLGGGRAALTLAIVVTWSAATATAELDGRALGSGLGLAVPLATFVGAYALTSAAGSPDDVAAGALFTALAAAAAGRQVLLRPAAPGVADVGGRTDHRRLPLAGRAAIAVGACAGLAAVLVVALPRLSVVATAPAALRRGVPVAAGTLVDPVDATTVRRDTAPGVAAVPELQVTVSGPSTGYLATAVLDGYDGGTWSFDATFRPTGGRVPAAGAAATLDRVVTERYHLDAGFPAGLLPSLQRPLLVAGTPVDVDRPTGMLVPAAAGMPTSYAVTSSAAPTLGDVPGADGLAPGLAERDELALPIGARADIAEVVRSLAAAVSMRPEPTVAFLQAVEGELRRADRRAVATATTPVAAGTALAQVVDATSATRVATPEQFATLFAIVARYLGVPARVVTGYRIPPSGPAAGAVVPAGTYQLTSRDAWTWAEVPVAGAGWVVADATPTTTATAAPLPPQPAQVAHDAHAPSHADAVPGAQAGAHALAPPGHVPPSGRGSDPPVLVAAAAVLVVGAALAVPMLAALRRRARRRRRRRGDAALRSAGAWLEVLDTLEQSGLRVDRAATTAEVARLAGGGFDDTVRRLAEAVGGPADQALCSSRPPTDAQADDAWASQAGLRTAVFARLDRRQRLVALLRVGTAPAGPLAVAGQAGSVPRSPVRNRPSAR
jgi:hypothetical protein